MANTFKKAVSNDITGATTVYTATGVTTVVIGFTVANKHDDTVTAVISAGGTVVSQDAPIPIGSSLVPMGGKIVLEDGDDLIITPSDDGVIDAHVSIMEIS